MEMNNVDCYTLENMLYLYIQKGQDDINTEKSQQQIGGTAECMKRLMMATRLVPDFGGRLCPIFLQK